MFKHFKLNVIFFLSLFAQTICYSQNDHWETVILSDQTWRYFIGTEEPDSEWRNLSFDDSSWLQGNGGIGYGDGDDNTVIDPTLSLYIRRSFTILDTSKIKKAVLHMDFDDAFVAYINDIEIARANIGNVGDIPFYNQPASSLHEAQMYEGGKPDTFIIEKEILSTCLFSENNVLAIQIHNENIESSDLSSIAFFSVSIIDSSFSYFQTPSWFIEPLSFESSNLPLIVINTNGQTIRDNPRIIAHMGVINHGTGLRNSFSDPFNEFDGRINIEIRGSSTQMFPKKSYAFETQDSLGENLNVSIGGLPPENDWILYAPYSDKSLMRNVLIFKLGNNMGHYNPRTRFCELQLNGEYQGVYVLIEKIKNDQNRLDIANLRPEDIEGDQLTGGYILKVDWAEEGKGWFSHGVQFLYHHPQEDRLQPQQKQYIKNYLIHFENVLEGSDYADKKSGYPKYLDVEAFIDFVIANEMAKNVDGFRISTFMHKDRDSNGGKIVMGPLWDFNLAFGNMDEGVFRYTYGWSRGNELDPTLFWWDKLMEDQEFKNQLKKRWLELRETVLITDNIFTQIDSIALFLDEAQERNFSRWPILGEHVWPNPYVWDTYEKEIDYLKNWISDRFDWIDVNIPGIWPPGSIPEELVLHDNFPNPFNEVTTIDYNLSKEASIKLAVYDLRGRHIKTLVNRRETEGFKTVRWNGRDENGKPKSSGIYLYKLSAGSFVESKKMILLK